MRDFIRYRRGGRLVEVKNFDPEAMLLDHLRLDCGATGTKEGCREGDCGACTVALARPGADGGLEWRPVNACILPLGAVDGAEVVTVDDLANGPDLHPIQQAFVDAHAAQCGFCTPGFIMALFALFQEGRAVSRQEVTDQVAGNLCRCTGYRPIIEAGLKALDGKHSDQFGRAAGETLMALDALDGDEDVFVGTDTRFFAAPASVDSLAALYAAHPDATIVAGATDVGLWITKQHRDLAKLIYVGRAKGFNAVQTHEDRIEIAAGATYAEAEAALAAVHPDVSELLRRLGSKQVRASGTIGGNIANGSPIGDSPPMLIAMGATVHLRKGERVRSLPLEAFFLDYGKQDRAPGELVTGITVPKPRRDQVLRVYKISKRFDQDISALMAGFLLTVQADVIKEVRTGFGGMAATPKRAAALEAALVGLRLDDETDWATAAAALGEDFTPISDMRASADYRLKAAKGLVLKALVEAAGTGTAETRVLDAREVAHG